MDIEKQKKLEPLRYIPIVGGLILMTSAFYLARRDRQLILSAIIAVPVALGMVLVALGSASIKLRRIIYSQEERIQKLEAKLLERADKSQ